MRNLKAGNVDMNGVSIAGEDTTVKYRRRRGGNVIYSDNASPRSTPSAAGKFEGVRLSIRRGTVTEELMIPMPETFRSPGEWDRRRRKP